MTPGLDREQWLAALEQISRFLDPSGPPIRLCLIGSVACVFGGMAARTSRDIDVWKPASDYDLMELKAAVEAAGLAFDPKTSLDPARPYVQIVEPGPALAAVRSVAESFQNPGRRHALENLVFLELADGGEATR